MRMYPTRMCLRWFLIPLNFFRLTRVLIAICFVQCCCTFLLYLSSDACTNCCTLDTVSSHFLVVCFAGRYSSIPELLDHLLCVTPENLYGDEAMREQQRQCRATPLAQKSYRRAVPTCSVTHGLETTCNALKHAILRRTQRSRVKESMGIAFDLDDRPKFLMSSAPTMEDHRLHYLALLYGRD